jgi:hypothetical protein
MGGNCVIVVHAACKCVGAILQNGNVWIEYLYALVSISCESMTVQPSV